ncbi:hypothetical protein [Nocardia asiatica]|uniref:hypothetical protein n=1 Tax=Nocardia asiatica TaxID=209252 RepID=UPI002454B831|nr:hypothetical protein [Nocardia asiatica]
MNVVRIGNAETIYDGLRFFSISETATSLRVEIDDIHSEGEMFFFDDDQLDNVIAALVAVRERRKDARRIQHPPSRWVKLIDLDPHHIKAVDAAAELTEAAHDVAFDADETTAAFRMEQPLTWAQAALPRLSDVHGVESAHVQHFRHVIERLSALTASK